MRSSKQWSSLEERTLSNMKGETFKAMSEVTGRSVPAVKRKTQRMGIQAGYQLSGRKRSIYAETIASAMEMRTMRATWNEVGISLGLSVNSIKSAVNNASKNGFDAYPKREDCK